MQLARSFTGGGDTSAQEAPQPAAFHLPEHIEYTVVSAEQADRGAQQRIKYCSEVRYVN